MEVKELRGERVQTDALLVVAAKVEEVRQERKKDGHHGSTNGAAELGSTTFLCLVSIEDVVCYPGSSK